MGSAEEEAREQEVRDQERREEGIGVLSCFCERTDEETCAEIFKNIQYIKKTQKKTTKKKNRFKKRYIKKLDKYDEGTGVQPRTPDVHAWRIQIKRKVQNFSLAPNRVMK